MNTTPWFASDVKPVRVGWYEVYGIDFLENKTGKRTENRLTFRYWDGKKWMWKSPNFKQLCEATFLEDGKWRGLTEEMK